MDPTGFVTLSRQSGLMREMQVVANNIANAATTGFRKEGMVFAEHLARLGPDEPTLANNRDAATNQVDDNVSDEGIDLEELDNPFPDGPPEVPIETRPLQAAAWYDVMTYLHQQLSIVTDGAEETEDHSMVISWPDWQRLLQLQMDLSVYQRKLAEPSDS